MQFTSIQFYLYSPLPPNIQKHIFFWGVVNHLRRVLDIRTLNPKYFCIPLRTQSYPKSHNTVHSLKKFNSVTMLVSIYRTRSNSYPNFYNCPQITLLAASSISNQYFSLTVTSLQSFNRVTCQPVLCVALIQVLGFVLFFKTYLRHLQQLIDQMSFFTYLTIFKLDIFGQNTTWVIFCPHSVTLGDTSWQFVPSLVILNLVILIR